MVDTLRCDETFASPPRTPLHPPPPVQVHLDHDQYQDLLPQFCHAYQDRAILGDDRVFRNMLSLECSYLPSPRHYQHLQDEIKIHMRKIVVDWMLDVCVDQRCHVDVFLLAVNIVDRFLDTIRMKKKQFQLLGAASIFLASKMIEPSPVSALTLVRYTADTYDREELLSMELLILSKLKWDLTAVTAYDYLDHLLAALQKTSSMEDTSSMSMSMGPQQLDSLRRQTERLITLCATDPNFLSLPPSMVASASLASAVQQDFESQPPPPSVNLKDILAKLQDFTKIEMDCLRHCIEQIEELILSETHSSNVTTTAAAPTSQSSPPPPHSSAQEQQLSSSPSEGFFSSPDRLSRPEEEEEEEDSFTPSSSSSSLQQQQQQQQQPMDKEERRESDNATPTEVFNVSAFCVR